MWLEMVGKEALWGRLTFGSPSSGKVTGRGEGNLGRVAQ